MDRARSINEQRLAARDQASEDDVSEEGKPYERENWENLVFRYEEPNAMARWDSPLFTVPWDDAKPSCDALWDAVIGSDAEGGKKLVRPNQATVLKKVSGEDYLYELDRYTQTILNRILDWTKDHPGEGGGEVIVGEDNEGLVVELPANPVGLPALQRLRRQFISLNRQSAVPVKSIRGSFVGYLNDSFQAA